LSSKKLRAAPPEAFIRGRRLGADGPFFRTRACGLDKPPKTQEEWRGQGDPPIAKRWAAQNDRAITLKKFRHMETINPKTYDSYIKALNDISRAITSDLFLADILKLIVLVTAKVMDVEICSLWLVDEEEKDPKIRLAATQALDPEYVKDRALNLHEGVVGFVVSTNKMLFLENVLDDPRFKEKEMAANLGLVSMLGAPLCIKENQVIGVLNCFTKHRHIFTDAQIALVSSVANQASLAISNARLIVRAQVIEEELKTRKKIERAKEILMVQKNLTGDMAFRWLQKKSMDTRKTMREIAEAIILYQDL
jgi:signal transduction protein with GAF and PtsI domain